MKKLKDNALGRAVQNMSASAKSALRVALVALAVVAVIALVGFAGKASGLWSKLGLDRLFDFDTKIDKTANVVAAVRETAEFASVCYYDEFVLNYTKDNELTRSELNRFVEKNLNASIAPKDRLVLICKGRVRAGFDLKKVTEDDIAISGDTLRINLPAPEYLDVVINPSDFEYFDRTGEWSQRQDAQVKMKAEEHLRRDADRHHILDRAAKEGVPQLQELYKEMGFKVVRLSVKR